MADEKDCLSKYDATWSGTLLEKKKWTEKKEGLEELLNDVTTPKIKPGDCSHIVATLMKLLTDSNINVSHLSVKCVKSLCEGLREQFAEGANALCPKVLQKFKEK